MNGFENRKILIIEDDLDLADIVKDLLEDYKYQVFHVTSGEQAYNYLEGNQVDMILLDINLPMENGFEICKEIRQISTVPIIFASARTSEDDRISALDMGGDDYLPKPYSLKELLSRVNALMRRTYGFKKESGKIVIGDFTIDRNSRVVTKGGKVVSLSLKEFDVLACLADNIGTPLKKEEILNKVWGMYSQVETSTVSVHIRWLREKLEEDPSKPTLIETVWGVGYKLAKKE